MITVLFAGTGALTPTAAQSTAAQSTVAQSTAAQSTAAQSTAAQSTAAQSTAAQSTVAQSVDSLSPQSPAPVSTSFRVARPRRLAGDEHLAEASQLTESYRAFVKAVESPNGVHQIPGAIDVDESVSNAQVVLNAFVFTLEDEREEEAGPSLSAPSGPNPTPSPLNPLDGANEQTTPMVSDRLSPDVGRDEIELGRPDGQRLPAPAPDADPEWELSLDDSIRLGLANNKEISVITPLPSVAAAKVSVERGDFDPVFGISTFGGETDRQVRSRIATFGAPVDFQETDFFRPLSGRNQTYLRQQLPTGGKYEIGMGTNYLRYVPDAAQLLVPSGWETALNLEYTQPLFRGRGRSAAQRELRIASARQRQSEHEFRIRLRNIVRDIDVGYWELAGTTRQSRAAEAYVRLAAEYSRQEAERAELGQSARTEILQVASVLNEFRVARESTLRDRRVAEMKLRTELGLAQMVYPGTDEPMGFDSEVYWDIHATGQNIEPVLSTPIAADIAKAMTRPELAVANARIEEARANLAAAKNKLLPDVNAHAMYSKLGLEKGLDDSVATIFDDDYHTWGAGVSYERRLRQRSENGEVRQYSFQIAHEQARQNELSHDFVGKLRELRAAINGWERVLKVAAEYVQVLTEQQIALGELYKDGRVSLFQRLENLRALQAAELDMHDKWIELAKAVAHYRYERGDDPSMYGVQIDSCGRYSASGFGG
ncbi:TolC family protein [Rubripirellula tenax]|uniref:TolC family protein n=1 Tax=Rubripirellula tenax TaxID=2528015 RepID=UPI0011B5E86A|nr:TolC family protein [Rubripirellula tenax]